MKVPAQTRILKFTQIKQWYFPVDAESYKILVDMNFPLLRFHQNMLPTLKLICVKKGVRGQLVSFKDALLDPFLDTAGTKWQCKSYRKAVIQSNTMTFTSTENLEASKKAAESLEGSLRRFFERWGYTATVEYSDTKTKCKLRVTYKFDSNRAPVLSLVDTKESIPTIRFKVGHLRFNFQLGLKFLDFTIEEHHGNVWEHVKTSRCLYSQIGDVRPMMAILTEFINKSPDNFDNPNS